jgi:glycine oxidase
MPAQGGFMSEHNPAAVDVAVIGGGAIGLAIAWRAQTRGLSTLVLERGAAGQGTSWVAAGMLAPIAEAAPSEEPLLELGLASASLYPRFVAELGARGYTDCGTLLVARDADEAEALERALALRERYGLEVERLRPSAARILEPGLSPALRLALAVPGDHAVDPRQLTSALAEALAGAGGQIRERTQVRGLDVTGGRVSGVQLTGGEKIRAGAVVIAAGAWSGELEGLPGSERPRLRPVKGQILRLHDPSGPGLLTRVVRMGLGYIVPRGDGRYVIGATTEERGFDTTVTAGAAFELLREASELVPGVSELVLDEFTAGLRPGTADNLPVIGPGRAPGLYWATGHGRAGILLAPVTAEIIVAQLCGEEPDPRHATFLPGRFARAAAGSTA